MHQKMLEFYPNLNINSGILQDSDSLQQCNARTVVAWATERLRERKNMSFARDAMPDIEQGGDPDRLTVACQNELDQFQIKTENISDGGGSIVGGTAAVKCEKSPYETCEGCGLKIHDRYLMRVADASWHEHCLQCCVCGILLSRSCYTRNTKLYCKADYDRIFGVKCSRCGDRLLPHEMVMRAQQHVFHLSCFVCFLCCQPLQKGEQFVLRGGQLFCRQDFEKEMFLMQQASPQDDDLLVDENSRPRDGRRGPKRPRTILTSAQRRQFKASFEVSPKPCRKVREALAKETGLSVRVVQVWFQNQRAKMKKIQRKAKQEADTKSPGDKDKDGKDDKIIKQESPSSEHGHYLGLGGIGDSSYSTSSQPLNPNIPYSPDDTYPAHSGDSFCSSDISLDDSTNFDHLDEGTSDTLSLQNLDLQSNHPHNSHEGMPPGTIANPIDKLYLMQNSYFNTEQ